LEQILLALKGAGLVYSKRGVGGGYVLARDPREITLAQIVSAVDGPISAGDFGPPHSGGACDHEGQCVLLEVWADVGKAMNEYLQSFTLADVADRSLGGGFSSAGSTTTERPIKELDSNSKSPAPLAPSRAR
jgi:Rrf2 family iron-sulfur cluster assembly transcriptional regulator